MPQLAAISLALAYGYLVGSIPLAYLVARWAKGIDIRQYGSGNVGASNVGAHVGRGYLVPVGAFDLLVKGATPVLVARFLLDLDVGWQAAAGLLAVVGHNWSLYLGFTGGRGIGTASGVLLALLWQALLVFGGVAVGGWLLFRSSALWVGIAAAVLPLWALLSRQSWEILLFCVAFLLITALKRVTSNPGTAPPGVRWRQVLFQRLLYDRDLPGREEWVHRRPPESEVRR